MSRAKFRPKISLPDSCLPRRACALAFFVLKTSLTTLLNVLVCAAFLACAAPAFAGKYQRTLDKKAHIWNDDPKPGEECNWSGKRDRLNLADGPGTLIWYNDEKGPTTRTQFTAERLHFVSKVTGIMLRGRWEGMVESMDADGHVSHALFDNGKLVTAWVEGPAPGQTKGAAAAERKEQAKPATVAKPPVAAEPQIVAKPQASANPKVVAEPQVSVASQTTPPPEKPVTKLPSQPTLPISKAPGEFSIEPKPLIQNSSSAVRSTPIPTKSMLDGPQSPVRSGGSLLTDPVVSSSGSGGAAGDLFHSLAAPPSLLQHRASLSPKEAAKIAEAELARAGLQLSDYPRRQLTYNPDGDSWIVSYEHGAGNEAAPGPVRVGVTVEDKSGKATLAH
jgi:hypothetical protein